MVALLRADKKFQSLLMPLSLFYRLVYRVDCTVRHICVDYRPEVQIPSTKMLTHCSFTIGADFHSATTVFWVASAYTLADVGFAVPFASLADIIGRFQAYLLALVLYLVFSIACGFAQSLNQLIAFRTLQGLGGSGLYALAVVIWPEMSTLNQKRWLGAGVGMVLAIAGAVGPLLGGAITSHTSWRW